MIEVPNFGSLRGSEREIVILRSDNGETWREHTVEVTDEVVKDILGANFDKEGIYWQNAISGTDRPREYFSSKISKPKSCPLIANCFRVLTKKISVVKPRNVWETLNKQMSCFYTHHPPLYSWYYRRSTQPVPLCRGMKYRPKSMVGGGRVIYGQYACDAKETFMKSNPCHVETYIPSGCIVRNVTYRVWITRNSQTYSIGPSINLRIRRG